MTSLIIIGAWLVGAFMGWKGKSFHYKWTNPARFFK